MLSNKKTSTQLSLEKEEQERQELVKTLMGEGGGSGTAGGDHESRKAKDKKKDEDENSGVAGYLLLYLSLHKVCFSIIFSLTFYGNLRPLKSNKIIFYIHITY